MSPRDRYAQYLKTDHWLAMSDRVKAAAGYRCQVCNSPHNLAAHHRTYERRGNERLDDLVCLCRSCHERFHCYDKPLPAPVPVHAKATTAKPPRKKVRKVPSVLPLVDVPCGDRITLTKELISALRTNSAFTTATLTGLGVVDLTAGWPARLVGTVVDREKYLMGLAGRYVYAD